MTNDVFDYVEEHFIDLAKVLYSNLMYWEGIVHTENRGNVRRSKRRSVLDLLKEGDDSLRRSRLSSSPAEGRKLPNVIDEWKKDEFVRVVLLQLSQMSANGVALNQKNLGIKRHIERLRVRLKRKNFKSESEIKDAEELVANYDSNPELGDVIDNPWKAVGEEMKKYGLTFKELKTKLNLKT